MSGCKILYVSSIMVIEKMRIPNRVTKDEDKWNELVLKSCLVQVLKYNHIQIETKIEWGIETQWCKNTFWCYITK